MKNSIIYCLFLLFFNSACWGQIANKNATLFAHKYLWDHGELFRFSSNFDSTKNTFYTIMLASKKFNTLTIKIYYLGLNVDHTPDFILIEKIDANKKSSYAILGSSRSLNDAETIALFFWKYPFPLSIRAQCYQYLISNHVERNYLQPIKLNEDSLFTK